jgi:hypothetical protein
MTISADARVKAHPVSEEYGVSTDSTVTFIRRRVNQILQSRPPQFHMPCREVVNVSCLGKACRCAGLSAPAEIRVC